MKILIIGGTGTISSAITRQLAAAGPCFFASGKAERQKKLIFHFHATEEIAGDDKEGEDFLI